MGAVCKPVDRKRVHRHQLCAYVAGNAVSTTAKSPNQWNYDEIPGGGSGAWNNDVPLQRTWRRATHVRCPGATLAVSQIFGPKRLGHSIGEHVVFVIGELSLLISGVYFVE